MSTNNSEVAALLTQLQNWFKAQPSVLVAYSGGVDSALLMVVAQQQLGSKALSCIGISPSYPQRECEDALALAQRFGAQCRQVPTEEHLDPNYIANPDNRCYFCKSALFDRLAQIAKTEGYAVMVDGNNADDIGDDRPGRTAAHERLVRSPLHELGLTKAHVRAIARLLDMPIWDKPAMACLSSRVPHGTPIVPGLLQQIEKAENVLAGLGFKQFRVRHHGPVARVELLPEDFPRALEQRDAIVTGIRATGYKFVTLDLLGFRSGGLHAASVSSAQTKVS